MTAANLVPLILSLGGIVTALANGFRTGRLILAMSCAAGCISGVASGAVLLATQRGDMPYAVIKDLLAAMFIIHFMLPAAALYRATSEDAVLQHIPRFPSSKPLAATSSFLSCAVLGAISAVRLLPQGGGTAQASITIILTGISLIPLFLLMAGVVFRITIASAEALLTVLFSFILLASSSAPAIDLFSPLCMKVMKFIHDLVHQTFESLMIPDHPFFRSEIWKYIGLLFGNSVGFWGAIIIWFAPALLLALSVRLERLPPVTHIRQGAQRRRLIASGIRERRSRMAAPMLASLLLAAAVYQSRYPNTEYWNPKPVRVEASTSGMLLIPMTGETGLEDGKIHKFVFGDKGRDARFFVLFKPEGEYAVTLDACPICKPDGYGQADNSVICYYCNTLIPVDTVGKPGGCNPVPIPFIVEKSAIAVDAATLMNRWIETVQATGGAGKAEK